MLTGRQFRRYSAGNVVQSAPFAGAVAVGLAIGLATSFAQGWLDGSWASLANAASPWLAGAFVGGLLQRRAGRAVAVGLLVCVLEVVGYYGVSAARGFGVSDSVVAFWIACGVVGGPLFGWGGWAWRRATGVQRAIGAALLPATFFAEAIGTYALRLHYVGEAVLFASVGVVLFLGLVVPARAMRTAVAAFTAAGVLTAVGVVLYWAVLDAAAGATFGALRS